MKLLHLFMLLAISALAVLLSGGTKAQQPTPAGRPNPFTASAQEPLLPAADPTQLPENAEAEPREQLPLPSPLPLPAQLHLVPMATDSEPGRVVVSSTEDGLVRLMVRDAPLRNVLALLAESQKLNLVFATTSQDRVTVSLDRVPLSTALDAILSSCGHTWSRQGNIIHVTQVSLDNAVTPTVQGRQLEVFELDFVSAVDIDLAVKGLLSPVGKSWVLTSNPSNNRQTREIVAVEDLPEYVNRIASYIGQTDQPPRQVMVEVQILAVDLDDESRHGVNLEELGRLGGTSIGFRSVGMANSNSSQAFYLDFNGGDLSALVEMLQTTADAKTLASPKLLAVNGQESRIQIGERLPYRITTTTQTSTQETIDFLEVGVVLRFTPTITKDGRILMRVQPKVSDGVVNSSTGLPEEETTELETDAFLNDGQGLVIGGLISERDSVNISKLLLLGDIPYAGPLFQRRQSNRARSEIIVAIMPHLLPYDCVQQAKNDMGVQRARDPLVHGPLQRYPRPYEPRLPDPANRRCPCAENDGCEWVSDGHTTRGGYMQSGVATTPQFPVVESQGPAMAQPAQQPTARKPNPHPASRTATRQRLIDRLNWTR